ncbi:MAG TPA: maleylpyruvate isomerase family mycothiol-dependent enzyme [Propionibacteriaceae bacterium]|nr:maleylpyruvate isomerase family mycothiol-dependent enzyme [Propionibacteriaceae bacterium]
MSSLEPSPDLPSGVEGLPSDQRTVVRRLVDEATHRLLGHTIAVEDADWHRPSRLPGWTRAHVATHLARQADGLLRLIEGAQAGERRQMYASPEQREWQIESGAGRNGLELQIDLDTSAGRLANAFHELDGTNGWDAVVELREGLEAPARLLPMARLTEVLLHHVDLDIGFEVDDIDEHSAHWLLEWSTFRLRRRDDFPPLRLASSSGFETTIGGGSPVTVQGRSAQLLGWLTGRADASGLDGADDVTLPPF